MTDNDIPETASDKLREVANWLDTYDRLAAKHCDILVEIGSFDADDPVIIDARRAASGSEVQDWLRVFADELEEQSGPEWEGIVKFTNPSTLYMDGTSPITVNIQATTDELRDLRGKRVLVRRIPTEGDTDG